MIVIGRGSRFLQVVAENRRNITTKFEVIKKNRFLKDGHKICEYTEKCLYDHILQNPTQLVVFCNYPWILKIDWGKLPVIICHAGKLPKYRGASVINWAYLNGEKDITTSIIGFSKNLDCGNIICEKVINIDHLPLTVLRGKIDQAFSEQVKNINFYFKKKGFLPIGKKPQMSSFVYRKRTPKDSVITCEDFSYEELKKTVLSCEKGYWARAKLERQWYEIYFISTDLEKIQKYKNMFNGKIYTLDCFGKKFHIIATQTL